MKIKKLLIACVILVSLVALVSCDLLKQSGLGVSETGATLSIDEILGTVMPKDATPLPPEIVLTPTPGASPTLQALGTPTTVTTPLATPAEAVCGGPDALIVTVLGIDEHAQADAIRLVRIDFVTKEVTALAIPRDFWVDVVGFEQYEIEENRINATYGFGEYFNGKAQGIIALNENLEANFGVKGDRYLVLHFSQIQEYVDIVGGVDLVLDKPVTDGKVYFEAGEHHFDGETAVSFMRVREYDSDFARVRRQTQVLTAFFKKVINEMDAAAILKLATKVITASPKITDLRLTEMTASVCLGRQLEGENIYFKEIPKDMFHHAMTNRGAMVLIPHPEAAEYIQSVINSPE